MSSFTLLDNREGCLYIFGVTAQLLAYTPPHVGGLQPLSFCLFHQNESVREATVDIFNELRTHPVRFSFSVHRMIIHVSSSGYHRSV